MAPAVAAGSADLARTHPTQGSLQSSRTTHFAGSGDRGRSRKSTPPHLRGHSVFLAGLRLLVVEDDPDTRELIVFALSSAGATVEAVETAAEAFEALDRVLPDLILSDIGLPGQDGCTFMQGVRARAAQAGGSIPSIAVTAFSGAATRERALASGFNLYMTKPVLPVELVAAVKNLARNAEP
jgi:CheY-like chemotaxis protein